jgi:hypothetical protein
MGKAPAPPDSLILRLKSMKARVLWQSCVVAAVGCLASGVSLAQSAVDCSSVAQDMARLKCYDEQAALQKKAAAPVAKVSPPATASPSTTATPPVAATSPAAAAPPVAVTSPPAAAPPVAVTSPTTGAVAAPAAVATPAPARPASGSSDFGLDAEALRRKQATANPAAPKEPEQVVARVKAVATKPRGEYQVTLEDGQVWEETAHSSSVLPPEVGETVTIKRGMLGSYFLSKPTGLALRVKRIN